MLKENKNFSINSPNKLVQGSNINIQEIEALMESTPDVIYTTDSQGNIVRVNSAFYKMTGLSDKVIGKNIKNLNGSIVHSNNLTLLSMEQKKPITLMQEINKNQKVIISSYPMFNVDGNITFVVTKIRDITELDTMKDELEKIKRLTTNYYNELKILRNQYFHPKEIIAQSKSMKQVIDIAIKIATVDTTVLINGESGTGKEVIAKLIHNESKRKGDSFVKINCGAIPVNLLESELFGYDRGAFSGAKKEGKPGLFEIANGGTLLLDEIGEMPLQLQVKFLRVLQDQEFYRIGGIKPVKTDVRILASTNRNLLKMVKENQFREDLYYRLNVVQIIIPPLRERKEDIIPLIYYFLKKYNEKYSMKKEINADVIDYLLGYDWPGNVRELENIVEHLVVLSQGRRVGKDVIPDYIINKYHKEKSSIKIIDIIPLKKAVQELEIKLIDMAFDKYKDINKVAKVLQVHRTTILRKKSRYID